MKVCQFILPKNNVTAEEKEAFEVQLVDAHGGFTTHEVTGAWIDPDTDELVREVGDSYDVAVVEDKVLNLYAFVRTFLYARGERYLYWAVAGSASINKLWSS